MQAVKRRAPPETLRELQIRAAALAGRSVGDLALAMNTNVPTDTRHAKGFVGTLTEAALGADPTAFDQPDFLDLGVELKTIPLGKNGKPKESTFVCGVSMATADEARWESSRLKKRLRCVLWMPIEGDGDFLGRRFGRALVWTPSCNDEQRLADDWEDLMGAIGAGLSARLSADLGDVLQVRPKAKSSRVRTRGPAQAGAQAILPLGFYLRATFTHEILQRVAAADVTFNT